MLDAVFIELLEHLMDISGFNEAKSLFSNDHVDPLGFWCSSHKRQIKLSHAANQNSKNFVPVDGLVDDVPVRLISQLRDELLVIDANIA